MKTKASVLLFVNILFSLISIHVSAAEAFDVESYIKICSNCHGVNGNSSNRVWPSLAGQNKNYLKKQLLDFRSGERNSKEMEEIIRSLPSENIILELAEFFSKQKLVNFNDKKAVLSQPNVDLTLGKEIYMGKRLDYGIPGCGNCHGYLGSGDKEGKYPRLSGQNVGYLSNQMKLFRSKDRSNDHPAMMRNISMVMDDEDIESVVAYIAIMSVQ